MNDAPIDPANDAAPAPVEIATLAEDCLPLPEPFPTCERCGHPLTLAATPWPGGGLLLRWLCFDRGNPQDPEAPKPCSDAPLRVGAVPALVPHPSSRVLVTRTELQGWFHVIDGAAAEILKAVRASRRQSLRRTDAAVRQIAAVLDEIVPRIDPALAPPNVHAAPPSPERSPAGVDYSRADGGFEELAPPASEPEPPKLKLVPVSCPTCGAEHGSPCKTTTGKVARRHATRAPR